MPVITRRDFLRLLPGAALPLIVSGCDFEYSPYSAQPSTRHLNRKNIGMLSARSAPVPETFRVALVSDIHTYYHAFRETIEDINAKGRADFVINCGDLTDSGLLKEYEWGYEILKKLTVPHISAIGNHDALGNGRLIYSEMFGAFNFRFSYNLAQFILFNNNNWEFGNSVPDMAWLERELQACDPGAVKIVVTHIPPMDAQRFSAAEQEQFHNLMLSHNVSMVISGHIHKHAMRTVDGVGYLTVGSVEYHREGGYVELTVSASDIYMEHILV